MIKTKEYLKTLTEIREEIRREEMREAELRMEIQSAGSIRYDSIRVQTSAKNKLDEYIIKLERIQERTRMKKIELQTTYDRICRQIEGLDNSLHREVLKERYIEEMSLKEIAEKKHYTEQYIRRVHGQALGAFAEKYKT